MTDDIVERLRAHEPTGQRTMGGATVACDATGKVIEVKSWGGEMITRLRNPDGPAAANRIEACEAELSVLREKYGQLIYSVARKCEGESRHETALRYIRERENAAASGTEAGQTNALTFGSTDII